MVPDCFDVVEPVRRKMQIAADRIRDRLRFVMIVKAGQIAPAGVTAQFDQAGADHDAKAEPAQTPSTQRSTIRYPRGRTRKASAAEACPRWRNQAAIGSKQENDSPELIHAHRSAALVAGRQLKTRSHTQTRAAAESRTASANKSFRPRKTLRECFRNS